MSAQLDLDPQKPLVSASAIAKALLDKDSSAEEDRWRGLAEGQLDREVEIYREGIRALSAELVAQGIDVSLNEEQAGAKERHIPGVEVRGLPMPTPSAIFRDCRCSSFDLCIQSPGSGGEGGRKLSSSTDLHTRQSACHMAGVTCAVPFC